MSTLLACVSRVTLGHAHIVEVDVQSAADARGADRQPFALAAPMDPPADRRLRYADDARRVGVGGPLLDPAAHASSVSHLPILPLSSAICANRSYSVAV